MDSEEEQIPVRVDIWLWSVRLFKTRSQAATACRNNRVEVNGKNCKPARLIRVGDRLSVTRGFLTREVEVKNPQAKRIGAKVVPEHLIDHTSKEAYEAAAEHSQQLRSGAATREAGAGRPTKRERRELDELMEDSASELQSFEEFVHAFQNSRSRKKSRRIDGKQKP